MTRVAGEAFGRRAVFDPSLGVPCGMCTACFRNAEVERDRTRLSEFGVEVLGGPSVCLRLAETGAQRRVRQGQFAHALSPTPERKVGGLIRME